MEYAEWCEVKHTHIGASWYFFHGEKYKSCPRSVLFLFNSGYSRDDLDSEALNLTNNTSSPISVTLHHCEQVMSSFKTLNYIVLCTNFPSCLILFEMFTFRWTTKSWLEDSTVQSIESEGRGFNGSLALGYDEALLSACGCWWMSVTLIDPS